MRRRRIFFRFFLVINPGTGFKKCIWQWGGIRSHRVHLAHMMSLTIHIELEWNMIAQNDEPNEADKKNSKLFWSFWSHRAIFSPGTELKECIWRRRRGRHRFHLAHLVSLTIYIDLGGIWCLKMTVSIRPKFCTKRNFVQPPFFWGNCRSKANYQHLWCAWPYILC